MKEQGSKEMGGFMIKRKVEDDITRRKAISLWRQRLKGRIQFPIQRNSEGKRKEVKEKYLIRLVFSQNSRLEVESCDWGF